MPDAPVLKNVSGIFFLVAMFAGGLAACGDAASSTSGALNHVHSLVVVDGTLYIATHRGMWIARPHETKAVPVGDQRPDLMAFAAASSARFVASGHPALDRSGKSSNLGVIETDDHGRSWHVVSPPGGADMHLLRAARQWIYGVDGFSGSLLVSRDGGLAWRRLDPPGMIYSLVVKPGAPSGLIASTDRGVLASANGGATWRRRSRSVGGLLAWSGPGLLRIVDAGGLVHLSRDGGRTWTLVATTGGGEPSAFATEKGILYLARTDDTVVRSDDGGRTWHLRARL